MKKILTFSILSLWPYLLPIASYAATLPQRGRCHDEFCLWEEVVQKVIIKREKGAILYKVDYIERQTVHDVKRVPGGAGVVAHYPDEYDGSFQQSTEPVKRSAFVFCYPKLPVVIGTIPRVLHLDGEIVTYAEANVAALYVSTCYDISLNSFFKGEFRAINGVIPPLVDSVTVSDPLDLFNYIH